MGAVNRTAEFKRLLGAAASGSSSVIGRSSDVVDAAQQQQQRMPNELYSASADIGRQIQRVQEQIDTLRKQSKKKGIFEDDGAGVEQLLGGISNGSKAIETAVRALEEKVTELYGPSHGVSHGSQAASSARNVVESLKVRQAEVMRDFLQVCDQRTKAAEKQHAKKSRYAYAVNSGPIRGDQVMEMQSFGDPSSSSTSTLAGGGQRREVLHGHDRADAVKSVNKVIGEVATMFKRMRELLEEQEYMTLRIDDNVDNTLDHLHSGQEHLDNYLKYISSDTLLFLKVCGIVLFFLVFFIVFIA